MPSSVEGLVPRRFEDRTLDAYVPGTPSQKLALTAARRLLAGEIRSLVLVGTTGVGKSHLAAGIVNAIIADHARIRLAYEHEHAEWKRRVQEHERQRPVYPAADPASREALRVWEAASEAAVQAIAKYNEARERHWLRQPAGRRPSPEWEAWDAEIPDLEVLRNEARVLEPKGPRPILRPTADDEAAYRAACVRHDAEAANLYADRPRHSSPPDPVWENVAELVLGLRLEMGLPHDDREYEDRVLALRSHTALVVLDDLGREKVSDWTGETIYALVNARYEAMLPTLVTSNLTAAELAGSPYWPVISRLGEDGALVEVSGPDHRLRKSA